MIHEVTSKLWRSIDVLLERTWAENQVPIRKPRRHKDTNKLEKSRNDWQVVQCVHQACGDVQHNDRGNEDANVRWLLIGLVPLVLQICHNLLGPLVDLLRRVPLVGAILALHTAKSLPHTVLAAAMDLS